MLAVELLSIQCQEQSLPVQSCTMLVVHPRRLADPQVVVLAAGVLVQAGDLYSVLQSEEQWSEVLVVACRAENWRLQ